MRAHGGGRSANDILALFDRLSDPFAGDKAMERAHEGAAGEAKTAEQTAEQQRVPVDVKLGFDQEDRGLPQQPQAQQQAKPAEKKEQPRETQKEAAKEEPSSKETREGNKPGKESFGAKLQHSLATAFAKLATLAKGEVAEKESAPSPAKENVATAKGALESNVAGRAEQGQAAEGAHDKANFGSITTEGDTQHQEAKSADKKDARMNDFREELRAMESGRDARKLDKPKEGKEAHELVKSEAAQEAPELRELIGRWQPETCNVEEQEQRANALRIEDALGEQMRCRGVLEDGARCIRKPILGIPYCREHASAVYAGDAGFVIGAPGAPSGAPEVTEPEALAYVSGEVSMSGSIETSVSVIAPSEELADPTLPEVPAFGEIVTD
jgi:hypothetical protein